MKKFLTIGLFLSLLILTGCSNVLILNNTVKPLDNNSARTGVIQSFKSEQPGEVHSISPDKKYLYSIGRSYELYTIDQYEVETDNLVNITTSDTPVFDVSCSEEGFYYTKRNPSDGSSNQVVWSSNDKTTEKTISDTLDNASENIYAFDKDMVVYVNNGNEIVFSNSSGDKSRYQIDLQLTVSKINWSNKDKVGFLIGKTEDSNSYNIYRIKIAQDNFFISLLEENAVDMDLESNRLVYLIQEENYVQTYILEDLNSVSAQKQFQEENIIRVAFDDGQDGLYLTKNYENGVRSTLWYYDLDKREQYQLTAPIKVISSVFPIGVRNAIFSVSQLTYLENSDIVQSFNYITKLKYDLS